MAYVSSVERIGIEKGVKLGVQQGMELGEARGMVKGRQEGESNLLLRLLARRFGAVPEWVSARLNQANTDLLETWGDRVLDAQSLEEVFGETRH